MASLPLQSIIPRSTRLGSKRPRLRMENNGLRKSMVLCIDSAEVLFVFAERYEIIGMSCLLDILVGISCEDFFELLR